MELSVPYYIMIGIVVLAITIGLIYTLYHRSEKFQCKVIIFLNKISLGSYSPTIPKYCRENQNPVESFTIYATEKDKIASELASYILACYELSNKGTLLYDKDCFEVVIENKPAEEITSDDIKDSLPNDYKDIFRLKFPINSRNTLLIMYNHTSGLIEVI